MSQRAPQYFDALFGHGELGTSPDSALGSAASAALCILSQLGGFLPDRFPNMSLPSVHLDLGVGPKFVFSHIVHLPHPLRLGNQPHIIQMGKQLLTRMQPRCMASIAACWPREQSRASKGPPAHPLRLDGFCGSQRHPAKGMWKALHRTAAQTGTLHSSGHLLQPWQHSQRSDVAYVRADSINGRDGGILVHVTQNLKCMGTSFTTSTCGQCVLEWAAVANFPPQVPIVGTTVRAVNLRITHTHMPQFLGLPSSFLRNAVIQPNFTVSTTLRGIKPWEKDSATRNNVCKSGCPTMGEDGRMSSLKDRQRPRPKLKVETPMGRLGTGSLGTFCLGISWC